MSLIIYLNALSLWFAEREQLDTHFGSEFGVTKRDVVDRTAEG